MGSINSSSFFHTPFVISNPGEQIQLASEQAARPTSSAGDAQAPRGVRPRIWRVKANVHLLQENYKKLIYVLPYGGTISAEGTEHDYKPQRSGAEVLDTIHIPHNVKILLEDNPSFRIDSKDLEPWHFPLVRNDVMKKLDEVDSVAMFLGSDTMSSLAFYLYLTIPKEKQEGKQIILIGAMKPANYKKPDGPINGSNALLLPKKSKLSGVMAVMNATGEIFGPPFTKGHTTAIKAFKAVNGIPIAQLRRIPGFATYVSEAKNVETLPARTFDIGTQQLPHVRIIYNQENVDQNIIIQNIDDEIHKHGAKAIVYVGTGNGSVNDKVGEAISQFVAQYKIPLIRASEVADGEVTRNDIFKDDTHNTICTGKLTPKLASILAQVVIAEARHLKKIGEDETVDIEDMRKAFDDYQTPKKEESPGNSEEDAGGTSRIGRPARVTNRLREVYDTYLGEGPSAPG